MLNRQNLSALPIALITISLLASCASDQSKPTSASATPPSANSSLKTPTKEILVFESDTNRSYVPLGNVEFKLDHGIAYGSTLDVPMEAQKELKEGLKKVAYTQYGDKVDAIINVKMGKQIAGGWGGSFIAGFGAQNTMASATGVAISYQKEPEPSKAVTPETPVNKPSKKKSR